MTQRKGMEMWTLVVGAVISIAILAIIMYAVYKSFGGVKEVGSCGFGGMCRPNGCADNERRALEAVFGGCPSGSVCCKPLSGSNGGGGCKADPDCPTGQTCDTKTGICGVKCTASSCPSGQTCTNGICVNNGGTTTVTPILKAAETRVTYLTGGVAPREIPMYLGTDLSQYNEKVTQQVAYSQAADCDGNGVPLSTKPDAVCRWTTTFTLQDGNGNVLSSGSYSRSVGGTLSVYTAPDFVGPPSPIPPLSSYFEFDKVTGDNTKFEYTLKPKTNTLNDPKFAGQRLRLIIYTYPNKMGDRPGLEEQKDYYFKILSPVSVRGLTTTWATKKDITVKCTDPVKCSDLYFVLKDAESGKAPACEVMSTISSTTEYEQPKPKYCQVSGTQGVGQCWEKETDCWSNTGLVASPEYTTLLQNIVKQFNGGQDISQLSMALSQQQGKADVPVCAKITSPPGDTSAGSGVYHIKDFDVQSQTASITLDRWYMQEKYFCVYGKDSSGKTYSGGVPQQIKIDLIPPQAYIQFNPLTLKARFVCDDTPPSPLAVRTTSGCKDPVGVAYITDATKFLPALASGSQSAATWCPSIKTGSYATETRHEVPYTSNEVRVLCLKVQDNAGNAAVTMATVYNGYDLLAKAIILATKK